MKHGKGEKAMSEEEVLEALEVIREALMRTARCFFLLLCRLRGCCPGVLL